MLNIDKTPDLPSVPDTELPAPKKKAPAAAQGEEIDVFEKVFFIKFV